MSPSFNSTNFNLSPYLYQDYMYYLSEDSSFTFITPSATTSNYAKFFLRNTESGEIITLSNVNSTQGKLVDIADFEKYNKKTFTLCVYDSYDESDVVEGISLTFRIIPKSSIVFNSEKSGNNNLQYIQGTPFDDTNYLVYNITDLFLDEISSKEASIALLYNTTTIPNSMSQYKEFENFSYELETVYGDVATSNGAKESLTYVKFLFEGKTLEDFTTDSSVENIYIKIQATPQSKLINDSTLTNSDYQIMNIVDDIYFTIQPQNQSKYVGENITLSAQIGIYDGVEYNIIINEIAYTWQSSTDSINWTTLLTNTEEISEYNISNCSISQNNTYLRCVALCSYSKDDFDEEESTFISNIITLSISDIDETFIQDVESSKNYYLNLETPTFTVSPAEIPSCFYGEYSWFYRSSFSSSFEQYIEQSTSLTSSTLTIPISTLDFPNEYNFVGDVGYTLYVYFQYNVYNVDNILVKTITSSMVSVPFIKPTLSTSLSEQSIRCKQILDDDDENVDGGLVSNLTITSTINNLFLEHNLSTNDEFSYGYNNISYNLTYNDYYDITDYIVDIDEDVTLDNETTIYIKTINLKPSFYDDFFDGNEELTKGMTITLTVSFKYFKSLYDIETLTTTKDFLVVTSNTAVLSVDESESSIVGSVYDEEEDLTTIFINDSSPLKISLEISPLPESENTKVTWYENDIAIDIENQDGADETGLNGHWTKTTNRDATWYSSVEIENVDTSLHNDDIIYVIYEIDEE